MRAQIRKPEGQYCGYEVWVKLHWWSPWEKRSEWQDEEDAIFKAKRELEDWPLLKEVIKEITL